MALYSFVDLTDDQKQHRRELLDRYGFIAQISVLAPLLVVQVFFLVNWVQNRIRKNKALDAPGSPDLKSLSKSRHKTIEQWTSFGRRFIWWCGDSISLLGYDLGTKGEVLGAAVWFAWLLLLSFLQTGDDYLHLTKRFGIVGASQLPFHYLLAIKTPYSPLQVITHASHETLNNVHQLLGRIVTLLFYGHAALYLNFYVQVGILSSKLKEIVVVLGLSSIVLFTIVGTSSLGAVRRASYRVFLAIHIALSIAVLPLLYFHVHHIRIYIYETLAILILNVVFRMLAARSYTTASIRLIPETQLLDISVPVDKAAATKWLPGQHAYLSLPGHPTRAAIAKNPFTVSSVPTVDKHLRFVARVLSGNTAALAKAASSGKMAHSLLIEGPYGVTTHPDTLLGYDKILLISGGIGATFIMPLYRQLLADLSPTAGSYRRQRVAAVCIVRSSADIAWALPADESHRSEVIERLRVFVTRPEDSDLLDPANVKLFDKLGSSDTDDGGVELEERSELLSKQEQIQDSKVANGLMSFSGRPNIARLVDQTMAGSPSERMAVVVCGPAVLGQAVRNEVGRWIHKGRDVWFWNEHFSL